MAAREDIRRLKGLARHPVAMENPTLAVAVAAVLLATIRQVSNGAVAMVAMAAVVLSSSVVGIGSGERRLSFADGFAA